MMTKEEIGKIIKNARISSGFTQIQVASKLGRPQQTIANWEVGRSQPDANTLFELFKILGADLNTSFGFPSVRTEGQTNSESVVLSDAEQAVIKKYRLLDPYGKEAVDGVLDVEWRRCTVPAQAEQPKQSRPMVTLRRPFTQVAAAEGAGAFLIDSGFDEVTVELNKFTQKADIILKVIGRSMEPEIHDGDHVLVRQQPSVENGEIGVFIIDGNGFLKQSGPDRLISLNPKIEDVVIKDQQTAECYGKYICVLDPEWIVE